MKKVEKKMLEAGFELLTMYGSMPFSSLVLLRLRHSTTTRYRKNTKSLFNTPGGLPYHLLFTDLKYLMPNLFKSCAQGLCKLKKTAIIVRIG